MKPSLAILASLALSASLHAQQRQESKPIEIQQPVEIKQPVEIEQPITTKPAFQELKNQGGRYVFGQVSEWREDKFLLDTQTGQLWRLVYDKNGLTLCPVAYDRGNDTLQLTPPDYEKIAREMQKSK